MINAHTIIADIRQDVSKIREDTGDQNRMVSGHSHFLLLFDTY